MASTKNSSTGSRPQATFAEAVSRALGPRGGVLLIDAECVLCNRFARTVIRADREGLFVLIPNHSETSARLLAETRIPEPPTGTIVLLKGGRSYTYSDVSLNVWADLGFPWSLTRPGFLIPRALRNFVYKLVADNRYRLFGKTTACGLLSTEERRRVLMG
jgi:predicted DCC family thiol-disulfide oxidoreductase YuxK